MYRKNLHVHFIGIGGIGMSGIATILKKQGYAISGCDAETNQQSVKRLQTIGCRVVNGHNNTACADPSIDVVVYSSAIASDHPELIAARNRGIPTIARALMLAELMRTKYSVAVSGSHGKTTTTSLISHTLMHAQLDPTVIIGGHLHSISNNAHCGTGDFLVAEADESDRSLLHLQATLAIVTNIDLEHLETYTDLDDIKQTFLRFLNNLPFYGKAIVCIDDPNIRSLLPLPHIKILKYGIDHSDEADWSARNITLEALSSTFDLHFKHEQTPRTSITLNMPGKHNVLNSLACIALAYELGVSTDTISQALSSFNGVDRRFTFKGVYHGAEVFDDYGHHPKEIEQTLLVARQRAKGKLRVIFQPHRYTRTQRLWREFIDTFLKSGIDELVITDIYAASEKPIEGVSSQNLIRDIQKQHPPFAVSYTPYDSQFCHLSEKAAQIASSDDLLLMLGAGKLNTFATALIQKNA